MLIKWKQILDRATGWDAFLPIAFVLIMFIVAAVLVAAESCGSDSSALEIASTTDAGRETPAVHPVPDPASVHARCVRNFGRILSHASPASP